MATNISINLNDDDELILNKLTDEFNSGPGEDLSPSQFLRQHVRDWIRSNRSRFDENEQLRLRAAYKQATPEEQATIDAILDKYR